jgi:hypothetical protein
MRKFPVPEFSVSNYDGTLFANLTIADERHPSIIQRQPIPPLQRVIAHGGAEQRVFDGPRTKDGSLDLRYRHSIVDKRDSWVELSRLLEWLEKAKAVGDVFEWNGKSAFPVTVMDWHNGGVPSQAAVLTAIQDWGSRPIYFQGQFEAFSQAVDRLIALKSAILNGTAIAEVGV